MRCFFRENYNLHSNKFEYLISGVSNLFIILFFSLSGITIFNFIFEYTPLREYRTIISGVIFVILDLCLIIVFLRDLRVHKKNKKVILFELIFLNIIYIYPEFIRFNIKNIIMYLVLVMPASIIGVMLIENKEKLKNFFKLGERLTLIISFIAMLYIISLIIFSCAPTHIIPIRVLTYGNIAWFFLPFLIITIINSITVKSKNKLTVIRYIYIAILTCAVCCSGLRTGMLVTIFTPLLCVIFLIKKNCDEKKTLLLSLIKVMLLIIIMLTLGIKISLPASRLMVVKDNPVYDIENFTGTPTSEIDFDDLSADGINNDTKSKWDNTPYLHVVDLENKRVTTLYKYLERKIFKSNKPEKEVLNEFRNQVRQENTNIFRIHNRNKDYAIKYKIHRNRHFLWAAAINEWEKNKYIGNGILHFQNKYEGTFPHNALLESLSDFGIVITALFIIIVLFLIYKFIEVEKKSSDCFNLRILVFSLAFIPSIFLYTSLYRNISILFMITILVSHFIKYRINSIKQIKI